MANTVYDPESDQENTRLTEPNSLSSNSTGQSGGGATSRSTDFRNPAPDRLRQPAPIEAAGTDSGSQEPQNVKLMSPREQRKLAKNPATDLRIAGNPATAAERREARGMQQDATKIPTTDLRQAEGLGLGQKQQQEAKRIPFTDLRDEGGQRLNVRKLLKRRNLLLATPLALIALFLFLLLILAGSLKLPTIMQEITTYEFARATNQFAQDSEQVTDESLALDTTNDSTYQALKKNFTETLPNLYTDIRNTTWGRLDAYRPSQVVQTLSGENHGLSFHFTKTASGREVLTDVYVDGEHYVIPQVTSFAKWVPGLNSVLETKNNTLFLSKSDFLSRVNDAMLADSVSTIVRGATLNRIIGLAKGSRTGWVLSKFLGLDDQDAQAEATIQTYSATQAGAVFSDNAVTAEITSADTNVSNATNTEVQDWQPSSCTAGTTLVAYSSSGPGYCSLSSSSTSSTTSPGSTGSTSSSTSDLEQTITTGFDQDAENELQNSLDPNLLTTTLGILDPAYTIFTPICIIYDGSVSQSQPAIDNQMNQEEDTYDQLAAEAGQEEKGDQTTTDSTELASAVSGTNAEIGDVTQSNPYQRSEGAIVNTSNTQSVEAGSDGGYDFSLVNALGVSGFPATVANAVVASNLCGFLTSTGVAAGLGVANLLLGVGSFGATEEGETAAGDGAAAFIGAYVKSVVADIIPAKTVTVGETVITRSALARARAFVWEKGLDIAKPFLYILPLTALAKMVVTARANEATNGLAQNSDLVNEADSGGNIEANKVEQSQEFGRPLLASEVQQSDQQSAQYVDAQNASKSFTQRYFALSNPDSLLTRVALDINSEMSRGILNSLFKITSMVFRPFNTIGSLLSGNGIALASPAPIDQDYGNVQFGWTQAEEQLINSNTSYAPLENQHILDEDNDGKVEQQIAQKYSICFGYSYNPGGNGDLDPNDPNGNLQLSSSDTIGNLLAGTAPHPQGVSQPSSTSGSGYIARDSSGNVINSANALCSPMNLSYDSPDPLGDNPWSTDGKTHDMIFRWRLAMAYDTTLDQLNNEQSVTSSASPSGGS